MKLQPASKKTLALISVGTAIGLVLMLGVFLVLHIFDIYAFRYTVVLGGVAGTLVAILNFYLMCLTIQAAAQIDDKKRMKSKIQLSYNGRMFLQAGWVIAAVLLPCFQPVAAALPLLFPSVVIVILRRSGRLTDAPKEQAPSEEESL